MPNEMHAHMADFWTWLGTLPPSSASFLGTLTGSGLGLFALLIGALFNAHLNRKRDQRLRADDRKAITAALRAELAGILHALDENALKLANDPPKPGAAFMVPDVMHQVQVMPHVLPKIGLLDLDTIRAVMDAYALLGQYIDGLIIMGGSLRAELPKDRRVVLMSGTQTDKVVIYNRNTAGVVRSAIDSLSTAG